MSPANAVGRTDVPERPSTFLLIFWFAAVLPAGPTPKELGYLIELQHLSLAINKLSGEEVSFAFPRFQNRRF